MVFNVLKAKHVELVRIIGNFAAPTLPDPTFAFRVMPRSDGLVADEVMSFP